MEERIFSVLQALPDNGQKVICFGYKTVCCKEDMDEDADWHEATFQMVVSCYRLKETLPVDVEDSVLESYKVCEIWDVDEDPCDGHVIGVTKWKRITKV